MKHVNKIILLTLLVIGLPVLALAYAFDLLPKTANLYNIGSSSLYWKDVYQKVPHVKNAANGKLGSFTLNGTTPVTVSNTGITTSSVILVGLKAVGGTVGALPVVQTITASTGFTIKGTASDTSDYWYVVVESF